MADAREPSAPPLCYKSGETVQVGDVVDVTYDGSGKARRAKVRLVGAGRSVNVWYTDAPRVQPEWVPVGILTFIGDGD